MRAPKHLRKTAPPLNIFTDPALPSPPSLSLSLSSPLPAWCPYCEKVWLWLEEKRIPFAVRKVTMFCYGEKDAWYKRIVPSGMLPAMELDGTMVTESDVILSTLEETFGPLGRSMFDPTVLELRRLERSLFSAWCRWLCRPARSAAEEVANRDAFCAVAQQVERALAQDETTPFFLGALGISTADVVFTPYIERMSASLFYYKGFTLRDSTVRPRIAQWFDAMEGRIAYRGMLSDFHTHCHDLPPQMGGCFANNSELQRACAKLVDEGPYLVAASPAAADADAEGEACLFQEGAGAGMAGAIATATIALRGSVPDCGFAMGDAVAVKAMAAGGVSTNPRLEALSRMLKFKDRLFKQMARSGCGGLGPDCVAVDEAVRCALSHLVGGELETPPPGTAASLRYLRDRISVPRDMSIWAARHLRTALEATAARAPEAAGEKTAGRVPIPSRHRRDQDPRPFFTVADPEL